MKWLLFLLSVFAMWVAFNSLFMLPGHYSAFNFELAGLCIGVGVLLAWVSGKRFVDASPKRRRRAAVMEAPPMVLCAFILLVFIAIGVVKFMAYR
jgi:uncharacterized membrane protein YidH (DUF202 family)